MPRHAETWPRSTRGATHPGPENTYFLATHAQLSVVDLVRNGQRGRDKTKRDESFMNARQRHAQQLVLNTAADDVKGNEGEKMFLMLCGSVSDIKGL